MESNICNLCLYLEKHNNSSVEIYSELIKKIPLVTNNESNITGF